MDQAETAAQLANTNGRATTTSSSPILETDDLLVYLRSALRLLLGAKPEELDSSLFADTTGAGVQIASFASDINADVIFVTKEQAPDYAETGACTYTLNHALTPSPLSLATLAIIKRSMQLDPAVPLESQLQIINLPTNTIQAVTSNEHDSPSHSTSSLPYEALYSIVHLAIAPYFDAISRSQESKLGTIASINASSDSHSKTGIPATKRRLAELELALLHLQQNIEIPRLVLTFHSVVQRALDEANHLNTTPTIDLIPQDLLNDQKFLNGLQSSVNTWIKSIQSITKMTRDPSNGTASQEINFWLSLEAALEDIDGQLQLDGVTLTMEILKFAKRFHATTSFLADTGLKESIELVKKYNILMNEFPIDELQSAPTLQKLKEAIFHVFGHLNRKIKISPYPISRTLPLVEAISGDLDSRFLSLLSGRRLMHLEFFEFRNVMTAAEEVFAAWDTQIKEFTNVAREVTRKRMDKFIPIRIRARHAATQERLAYVKSFRQAHEQLLSTIKAVLGSRQNLFDTEADTEASEDVVNDLAEAYGALKDVDVLDVSPEGTDIWLSAEAVYNERTSRTEDSIIIGLRGRLATARTANEMFRVFSQFNALFIRPKIRGAIREYQNQLIDSVKLDIEALHDRFLRQYPNSDAFFMDDLRDLPPISGAIIWVRQIERQLDLYMKRVEDVLGKGWAMYSEGAKLQNESISFRKKLDSKQIFDSWLRDITERRISVNGRLFNIGRTRFGEKNRLELTINFDPQVITLFKEVRNLTYLKYQVPHVINSVSKDAKKVYPYAMGFTNSLRAYTQATMLVEKLGDSAVLMNDCLAKVHEFIESGMKMTWESFVRAFDLGTYSAWTSTSDGSTHESMQVQFARNLNTSIAAFEQRTLILADNVNSIDQSLQEMRICGYNRTSFAQAIENIQTCIDKLNLENFANLNYWVRRLNDQAKAILLFRLRDAISSWINNFSSSDYSQKKSIVLEIVMRNQSISLSPPLEHARAVWYSEFQDWVSIVCGLTRLDASRYDLKLDHVAKFSSDDTFSDVLDLAVDDLSKAYNAIEEQLMKVSQYTAKWLHFQSLWDLQPEKVFELLGNNLSQWVEILQDIRKVRSTFDTTTSSKEFGQIVIEYDQVQARINAKYDSWQHEILLRFAELLRRQVQLVYADLERTRKDLEVQTLDISSTKRSVEFVLAVQNAEVRIDLWSAQIVSFRSGQIALARNRFQFPSEWIFTDQIDSEWSALSEILSVKQKTVSDNLEILRTRVLSDNQLLSDRIARAISEWNTTKPLAGSNSPDDAFLVLEKSEIQLNSLKKQQELLLSANGALGLQLPANDILLSTIQEVQDFKYVWSSVSSVWKSLNEIRETPWSSVVPRKVKSSLEELLVMTKEMPSRMRQYASFEYVQGVVRQYLKSDPILNSLKSDVMRERHWELLFRTIVPNSSFQLGSMTLGNVWDFNLTKNELVISDIITQARGQMTLDEYLKQVREFWNSYELELVNYQNKCRLIRGWDVLFEKCAEHMNSLAAMHHSPYYKFFEEEVMSWEDKLNRINVLFDTWMDVQRRWVYLEGVFSGNAKINNLLPIESARFQNINSEFYVLMRTVSKSPTILSILQIPGSLSSLQRLTESLARIQKSLGEYLERERMNFPRYYFVGDEDLLEIIGNAKDIRRIQKYLKKMFAGISALIFDEQNLVITGFQSTEGEVVELLEPISLVKSKVNEWLQQLEVSMKESLANLLPICLSEFRKVFNLENLTREQFVSWIQKYPAQIVVLTAQIISTSEIENQIISESHNLSEVFDALEHLLELLASIVLEELARIDRKKCEALITELVHQRNIAQHLIEHEIISVREYPWVATMRFYYYESIVPATQRVIVRMGSAAFRYGFEYLGVQDRLVQTPLTDKCFLALTGALEQNFGGSPFGPAGTGKTESIKSLGAQLGRFVLVFNCDETFNFQSMGRIFFGICQVGAWGCFDEFNRLEERVLSAVSSQIQTIQLGLRALKEEDNSTVELLGRQLQLQQDTGIFITMNPDYAGRSNLPDNLKKLFRSISMSSPDRELITEVILFTQGFVSANGLSRKIVPFFDQLTSRLSHQYHYDFGLRALKSVLANSGEWKRRQSQQSTGTDLNEDQIILRSIHETILPKLVGDDTSLLGLIEKDIFPNIKYVPEDFSELRKELTSLMTKDGLVPSDSWLEKATQVFQIQQLHHGIMIVGKSGSGKSTTWKYLLRALQRAEDKESVFYIIDAKVMTKDVLYGTLDTTTREWTDGLFTGLLRKINDNLRGESTKRHWIVFDGDVDPEWAENLNSVLDDNRILTLANGERLALLPNIRLLFEVSTLEHATLATVSRCGMVWLSEDNISTEMLIKSYTFRLQSLSSDDFDENLLSSDSHDQVLSSSATYIEQILLYDGWVNNALEESAKFSHIMEFAKLRSLHTMFSLLNGSVREILEYNGQHPDFPLITESRETYLLAKLLLAAIWSFAGDCPLQERHIFAESLSRFELFASLEVPSEGSIIDYDVSLPLANWTAWQASVPQIDLDPHSVTETDIIIPTVDTLRHESLLRTFLLEKRSMIMCGPPGSGKTMSLFNTLRRFPNLEVITLNFSSMTTPQLIIRTLEQYCEYRKQSASVVLCPRQVGRQLVIFCDEINLPKTDEYGTQTVISFLRQLLEHNGFWRPCDKVWVSLEGVQFVGACNPPTDAGRAPLSLRFLWHTSLVMIDYPGKISLSQIYATFVAATLKIVPTLRGYGDILTRAMIDLYLACQTRFTALERSHYVYSPRELTRWVRGVHEALAPLDTLTLEGLVRIWAYEALRLFGDRLVTAEEHDWMYKEIVNVVQRYFLNISVDNTLKMPILYSNWLSSNYQPVSVEELREYTNARLKIFSEEEMEVDLVLYDDALDHILRIDRVFKQPQGHMILIGISGSGKTTLTRFVAWMNGLRVFQINAHSKYSAADFDDDLRDVLRNCGCKNQKICFIFDESNALETAFLERMNTLLANAEVPGLFEGEDYTNLLTACKEGARQQGFMLDSLDELNQWFRSQIVKNLHVVFTMNPPKDGLSSQAAASPALFNRCVLSWMGDWTAYTLYQVGSELIQNLDLDTVTYQTPATYAPVYHGLPASPNYRQAIVCSMVNVHESMKKLAESSQGYYVTPKQFLNFVSTFDRIFREKKEEAERQQRHLNTGLEKLQETVEKVRHLRTGLAEQRENLQVKSAQADEKLQQMVVDQREAEKKQAESFEIQAELAVKEQEIGERQEIVMNDLAQAEPAVLAAQESVSNIKKQHLTEVRSMGNPPEAVKLAMEAVCILLGHKVDNWRSVQSIIRREDFISSIVNYSNDRQMTRLVRNKIQAEYLSRPNFNFETVNRASKACGPLILWLEAQINYSLMLERIGPLRREVRELSASADETKQQVMHMNVVIQELEASIEQYKEEYAVLISEAQTLKAEMAQVESTVNRSVRMLSSLASERERWRQETLAFDEQIKSLPGDSFLASILLVYGGFYDQYHRQNIQREWREHLLKMNIPFNDNYQTVDFLVPLTTKNNWHNDSLPVGQLYEENALMLARSEEYSTVIDPTGGITEFLRKQYPSLITTSFLDEAFVNQLENCLRFGNTLLVNDAEHFDPMLNNVLTKQYQRVGGRILIQLGKQHIDFSPGFHLILLTRDSSARFSPDICSHTTIINFTVTRNNLLAQSLNEVMKFLRPDIEKKIMNLTKLRRGFSVNLKQLEESLLKALNDSEGNILDDDSVLKTLEDLKAQSADISQKVAETEDVLGKIEVISNQYEPVAAASSTIFTILDLFRFLSRYYQFSLSFFEDIFRSVLSSVTNIREAADLSVKLKEVVALIYFETFRRTASGLLRKDLMMLALILAYSYLNRCDISFIEALLSGEGHCLELSVEGYDISQLVIQIKDSPLFLKFGIQDEESFLTFLSKVSEESEPDIDNEFVQLLFLKLVRSSDFTAKATRFVERAFGTSFLTQKADDIALIVSKNVIIPDPIFLCSVPGYDASYKVEAIAKSLKQSYVSIAMGSQESTTAADKAILTAAQNGSWVLLKNVHLAADYLDLLETNMRSLRLDSRFRLLLSMEISKSSHSAPVSLLRSSTVLIYEPPPGLRANMRDTMSMISKDNVSSPPVERGRLYFLLSWFHAVIQERLRFGVLGWHRPYEFNDADFEFARSVIDKWIIMTAGEGRTNIAPSQIPWQIIKRILVDEVYGGQIENDNDLDVLESIAMRSFSPETFEIGYKIVANQDDDRLVIPEGSSFDGFKEWVERLPDHEPSQWLGLPADAVKG
ncbi:dynein heavy chain, N-terminal region 1-domain-containing protein [Lipomyces oligophaga]|uniref:dynein heavy chain, N-terminal region 1-domain-containing protein n=1 Tax=Lipomyces oligophaga TaxID=45792 RepID=UPI0034CD1DC9